MTELVPQNLTAEESVLGAILLAGASGVQASAATLMKVRGSGLEPGDFYRDSHRLVYAALLEVAGRDEPTEVLAIEAELRARGGLPAAGGRTRLHELAALVPATANAGHYARLVVEAAEQREEVETARALRIAAENGGLAANPEVRERVERLLRPGRLAASSVAAPWHSQPWSVFRSETPEDHRWLVQGLVPAGMLAFIAGPPKKGKTWIGLALALAIATGRALFGAYEVPEPRNVLYVALEGSRVGLRARIGALARGLGLDPDGGDLDRLTMLYRPRPFDLADPATGAWLKGEAEGVDAALVVVDVLRAAARFKENVAEDFAAVRDGLEPLLAGGRTVPVLHHFGKLTETQKERSPGERMAGTGAMYGALDVGFLITKSESGARRLRVEIEARDFAAPDALGVVISGTGSGEHGGLTYADTATVEIDPAAAEDRDLAGEIEALFGRLTSDPEAEPKDVWRTVTEIYNAKEGGIGANKTDVEGVLEGSPERFVRVEPARIGRHPTAKPWGTVQMLRALEEREKVVRDSEPPEPPTPISLDELQVEQVASPKGEPAEPPAPPTASGVDRATEPPEPPAHTDALADTDWLASRFCFLCEDPALCVQEGNCHEIERLAAEERRRRGRGEGFE
jgi:hypothetical protein